jgi:hypothetical protein
LLAQEQKRPGQALVRDRGGSGVVHVDARADGTALAARAFYESYSADALPALTELRFSNE